MAVGICAIRILERVDGRAVVDQYLPDLDQRRRSTAERLVEVVLGELPDAQQARKWDRLTFTRDGDWHHWICAIAPTKNAVKLVIHKGAMLDDPHERRRPARTRLLAAGCAGQARLVRSGRLTHELRDARSHAKAGAALTGAGRPLRQVGGDLGAILDIPPRTGMSRCDGCGRVYCGGS